MKKINKQKLGNIASFIGYALLLNASLLKLIEIWKAIIHSMSFMDYAIFTMNGGSYSRFAFLFLVPAFFFCVVGVFLNEKKRLVSIAATLVLLIGLSNPIISLLPPSPEGLKLDQLEETHTIIKYKFVEVPIEKELETLEKKLLAIDSEQAE